MDHARFGCRGVCCLPALLFDFVLRLSVLLRRNRGRLARLAAARALLLLNFLSLLVHCLLQLLLNRSDVVGDVLLDGLRLFWHLGLVDLLVLGHQGVDRHILDLFDLSVLARGFFLRSDLDFGRRWPRLLLLSGMSALRRVFLVLADLRRAH